MKKALVIYQSKKGHTRRYGEEIGKFLQEKGLESSVIPVEQIKAEYVDQVSYLFLGCWTSGLFLMLQHPDKKWIRSVKGISIPDTVKTGFFTTYKLATGIMFKSMKKHIPALKEREIPEWKSKTGALSDADKEQITRFIAD